MWRTTRGARPWTRVRAGIASVERDAKEIIGRYPKTRSALLPLLHLVQSEDGYVSDDGHEFCAEMLGLSKAEVVGVSTFYTMYKRKPAGEYHVGVCINTLCAVMGGDQIWDELSEHTGVEPQRDERGRQGLAGARWSATPPATSRR